MIESDLCKKNEDSTLAANSLLHNLGNLESYIFACFRHVTFKLDNFMNVTVLFLVVLLDFCQTVLVC